RQQEDDAYLNLGTGPLAQLFNLIVDEFLATGDVIHFWFEHSDKNQPCNNGKDNGDGQTNQHPLAEANGDSVRFFHVPGKQGIWRGTNQSSQRADRCGVSNSQHERRSKLLLVLDRKSVVEGKTYS